MERHTHETYFSGQTCRVIDRGKAGYPERLEKLREPPERLWVCGDMPSGPAIAIVGSRKTDPAAVRFTRKIARELCEAGVLIISGGAAGIDTAAHDGALEAGAPTVAVLGSGFEQAYPKSNQGLFRRICERGAVLSELHPKQPPTRWTFPKRNRIVAALCHVVLVVQAGRRSGALITANFAASLGVPVAAAPGPAAEPSYAGSNDLLRKGAHLVECAGDALSVMSAPPEAIQLGLPGLSPVASPAPEPPPLDLPENETRILAVLGARALHIDEIAAATGMGISAVSAGIVTLEVMGLIEDQGGRTFVKTCA